jgi:2-phosphoglycolate phosphatase
MHSIETVLFDLDGTLLDTAPDMAHALNTLRQQHGMPNLELDIIRPLVGYGSKALLKLGFNVDENHRDYLILLEEFFNAYQNCLAKSTALFPGMPAVLQHLEEKNIPWGIVTNKPARFTMNLLDALDLTRRSACIVCGDTLTNRKPHPEPILYACKLLKCAPENALYVGDTATDVVASKAAGSHSLVALYGYISAGEDPYEWQADGYIETAGEIIHWV